MTIADVLAALTKKFPKHAGTIAEWTKNYTRVLAGVPEDKLERVLNAVLDRWEKTVPPLPADFVETAKTHTPQVKQGMWGGTFWYRVRMRTRDMTNRYENTLPTTYDSGYRYHLVSIYRDKAWLLAQQIELGDPSAPSEIVLTEADLDNARGRADSQAANFARHGTRGVNSVRHIGAA